jgi:hypothetical protein
MQLIWIPSSTSSVKKIAISKRDLIKFGCLASLTCILIGVGVHFLGFRIAIQYSPELARGMGGVITVQEKEAIESSYRQHLQELRSELSHLSERITEIRTLKDPKRRPTTNQENPKSRNEDPGSPESPGEDPDTQQTKPAQSILRAACRSSLLEENCQ